MATYTEISIPFKSGTVNIEFNGVSLCDFHLIAKQVEDYIATRVSESAAPGPMVPLGSEERSAIAMTSWHTPPIGDLEAPFEDLTKGCHSDDTVYKPVITEMPKKPKSAWQYFICHSKLGIKETAKRWREIEPSLKEHYEQIAASDKLRYAEEMKSYNEYKSKTEKTPESTPQFPSAPIGWSGPYPNTWVKKNVQVNSRPVKIFKTFEEAVEVANTMKDCGGITQCPRGFSLRVGKTRNNPIPHFIENGKYRGICSWVKTVQEPPCYDGSDGITSYHDLNCTVRAYN